MFSPRTRKTILKLKKIFMLGYCPQRSGESYSFVNPYTNINYYKQINCFAHACFNLTNNQITSNCFEKIDISSFKNLIDDYWETNESIANKLFDFVKKTGLKIEECSDGEKLEENQWKVALYFCDGPFFRDFHFLLKEKDGRWSSKYGNEDVLEFFNERPKEFVVEKYDDHYKFYGTYKITNPYAGKNKENLPKDTKELIIKYQEKCKEKLNKKNIILELK